MKAYISVDMDGIAGIGHRDLVIRGTDSYPEGVALMTAEANAAIEGAFAGGATRSRSTTAMAGCTTWSGPTSIRERASPRAAKQADGHGAERRARAGIRRGAVRLISRPSGQRGTLAHTYQGAGPLEVRLDVRPVGGAEINAACLAAWGSRSAWSRAMTRLRRR